ncbi:MAG: L-seryl-tRNA(Sec) selenium transferase [Firmicutes bacterium]|mgnify:CR=1 FL=1|nr:L-seryl-tRNA(Sec) selenium transferase [Bacillota bacterium]
MSNLYRHIPAVNKVLADPQIIQVSQGLSSVEVTAVVRSTLDQLRQEIAAREEAIPQQEIMSRIALELETSKKRKFQPVINATGVLLHTNLGRAPLPQVALERLRALGEGYFNLELDLRSGARGSRYASVARLFNLLLAAELGPSDTTSSLDTVIVNNNAGAVLVALKALTAGQEVIVSRGQLVEIGGGFRVPDVMAASGCQLKEVGTTNRTRVTDYAAAITEQTKAILLVHPSNYAMIGFTESTPREELAQLAQERGILLIEDIGSGAFEPFAEPLVSSALKHSHIVTYSGDKLFGGPQAGIISGRKDLVDIIKRDPLLRALRIDKLSLIALEAVLELHLNKDYKELPLCAMAQLDPSHVKQRAEAWQSQLGPGLQGEVVAAESTMGGGSLPGETIASWALALQSPKLSSAELHEWLRRRNPPIMGRIVQDRVLLDPRTVLDSQDESVLAILRGGLK